MLMMFRFRTVGALLMTLEIINMLLREIEDSETNKMNNMMGIEI